MSEIEPRPQSSLRKDDDFDDLDRELETYIGQHEEQTSKEENVNTPLGTSSRDSSETMEKGQQETVGTDKKERLLSDSDKSDNEDSEPDDYNLTEDQRRALEELDNLKSELGYPDEEPPEYDVKERLKVINEDLANDPTPIERSSSKVGFKQNLVDLVAPPPDYGEDDEEDNKTDKSSKNTQKQSQEKDKTDEKSETISAKKSNTQNTKEKVLIERDGQFELVNADDVRAQDLGLIQPVKEKDKENEKRKTETVSEKQPAPPPKPRPATATASSRRNIRVSSAKPRPQSAGAITSNRHPLDNFSYNSPYAMSPREKELMEERKKALEKHKKDEERRRKLEDEHKEKDNRDAFEYWLKKKREQNRRKKIGDEDERKRQDKQDRGDQSEDERDSEQEENEEAFKSWLKEKSTQFKKEKLLKRRQEQEAHDGYYVRSRDDCDKAFRQWLKHKAQEARKARAAERMKARLHRLAARRTRKSTTLAKAIKDSQTFRYVDYYGYRF